MNTMTRKLRNTIFALGLIAILALAAAVYSVSGAIAEYNQTKGVLTEIEQVRSEQIKDIVKGNDTNKVLETDIAKLKSEMKAEVK